MTSTGAGAARFAERLRIVGFERRHALRPEAQAREDRLRQRERLAQACHVVARLCPQQQAHRRRAVGEGGGDGFEADLRHLVDRKRQDIRGQAVAEARERVDQRRAVGVVVKQHDRLRAAGVAIAREQRAQLAHQRVRRRQRIGRRAGRADRGALAATGADIGVDGDRIAGGRDRARRAEIEAARAADDARARMGAEVGGEVDVARFVEGADEIARLQYGLEHGGAIAGIGAQIAGAQIGRGEERGAARNVQHKIALRHRAVARRGEAERAA